MVNNVFFVLVPIRSSVHKRVIGSRKQQVVLLVWTPQGRHGAAKFASIIAANCFHYCFSSLAILLLCLIFSRYTITWNYLRYLRGSSSTWLDSILAQRSIKVTYTHFPFCRQNEHTHTHTLPSTDRINALTNTYRSSWWHLRGLGRDSWSGRSQTPAYKRDM